MSEIRENLKKMIMTKSYQEGEFTLNSGKKSNFMINLKPTSFDPQGAKWIGEMIFQTIQKADLKISGVGGMTLGADPLATATSIIAVDHDMHWPAFIVRKEAKGHGTKRDLEGLENFTLGDSVVVLEDVTTTGGTSLKAVEKVKAAGLNPVAILTVVDRQEGGRENIENAGIQFLSIFELSELKSVS